MKRFAFVLTVLGACSMLWQCKSDNSTGPSPNTIQVTSINPANLSLGSRSVTLTITGAGFVAGVQVELGEGIEITSLEVRDAQTIDLIVNVSPDAAAGPRSILVRSGSATARLDGTLMIIDNRAPVASFIINPSEGTLQSVFQLDATDSSDEGGRIVSYQWKISDGTTARGIRVKKEFTKKGTYTVKLTVTDDRGGISTAQKNLEVGTNKPPLVTFSVSPSSGNQLTLFTFDGSGSFDPDGTIQTFRWEINGKIVFGRIVTARFPKPGEFEVLLKVRDSGGADSYVRKRMSIQFFDREKAVREVQQVVLEFLRLFDKIEQLSAQQIVVGFSKNPECFGRSREISIIELEQPTIRSASVEFLGDPVVEQVDDRHGRASITNRFYGTRTDGSSYSSGRITHHFTMVHETDGWKICNFVVTEDGNSIELKSIFGHR